MNNTLMNVIKINLGELYHTNIRKRIFILVIDRLYAYFENSNKNLDYAHTLKILIKILFFVNT